MIYSLNDMLKRIIEKFINKLISIFGVSFLKFGLVGAGGMVTNLTIFYIFVDVLHLWRNVIAVIAFLLAGIQNYIFHHLWTFKDTMAGKKFSFFNWIKFMLASLAGLGINLIVMNLIVYFFHPPYEVIAQGCGVVTGTVLNYLGSKHFVFNKKETSEEEVDNPRS
jgi:putative flippase GtrA